MTPYCVGHNQLTIDIIYVCIMTIYNDLINAYIHANDIE